MNFACIHVFLTPSIPHWPNADPIFCGLFVSCLWTENTPTLYRLVKVEFPIIFRNIYIMSPWFLSWCFLKLIFPSWYFPYISHIFPIYQVRNLQVSVSWYFWLIFPSWYFMTMYPMYQSEISKFRGFFEMYPSSGGLAGFGSYEALGSLRALVMLDDWLVLWNHGIVLVNLWLIYG